ncbi:MAG TPA: peptidyl-prolyl cis-trans isomerase [Terriglobales bacterium]|nr:peptidyl-prolyl cis-trans isomerase [Terriglobales bacterium]
MKALGQAVLIFALAAPLAGQQLVPSHAPTAPATASAAAPSAPLDLKKIAARVNGVAITERDVREQMQRLFPYYSIHGGKVPEKYQGEIRQKAIDQLVTDELMFQQAKKDGMKLPAAEAQGVLRQARARFGSQAAYEEFGKDQYGSVQEFERRLRRATLIAEYQNKEIVLKSRVTDLRLRRLYEKNKKTFLRPESVWLQTITINVPPNPSDEQKKMARKRIEEILPLARAAKTFEQFGSLAEKVSEDDYRVMMGDRKWIHMVGLPPEIKAAVDAVQVGQISGVIETAGSLTILRVNDRRPQKQMSFDEVKDKLRAQLEEATRQDRFQILEKQLRKGARIEVL